MASRTDRRADGFIVAVAGTSRFGKTGWVKQATRSAERLLIWDIRGEYRNRDEFGWPGCQTAQSVPELARLVKRAGAGKLRLAYWGSLGDFSAFCRIAYLWTQLWPSCTIVEELADVTSPSKAPGTWGELIRKGAYYGHHLYAITQRPAEADKTLWGNAHLIHSHGFVLPRDCAYMADVLGCDPRRISGLKRREYLEREAGSSTITAGKLG